MRKHNFLLFDKHIYETYIMKKEIKFSLIYRDMFQSSGKFQPRVDQLVRIAPVIIDMGCFARVETNGGAFEQVNLMYGENPNKAVRAFTKPFNEVGIKTHMLDRGLNALRMFPCPADLRKLMYKVKHAQGVDITRIFCGLNDPRNIIPSIKYAIEGGMTPQATLCITYSPVHTVEYYTKLADQLIEAGAAEICLKDMAGIGRPWSLGQLVKNIKERHPEIIIQYHGHSGPGLSMASMLEVAENGADVLDVAIEPLSWGKVHPDVISVRAMLKDAGFQVPDINMMLRSQGKPEVSLDDLVVRLFEEVEEVWPKVGYPPLVTPFSQYVKNIALMNIMAEAQGKPRFSLMTDKSIWGMILGKSGKLPGEVAPEIIELAKEQGQEFFTGDPQSLYPDDLDKYRAEMIENGWDLGPDDEELFEFSMHETQYRAYKSGVAKERFEADLQKAKDAVMAKSGFSEEDIKKVKRAKAEPIVADEKGKIVWEIDVVNPSIEPAVGKKYAVNDPFCYIMTPWGGSMKQVSNFNGRIVEVCVKQGETVNKGDVLAYIQKEDA